MRDPECTPSWSDTFTFRVKYQESRKLSTDLETNSQHSVPGTVPEIADKNGLSDTIDSGLFQVVDCKVMRFSSHNLTSLRSLPPASLFLLLTPVLTPAYADYINNEAKTMDPFETFGRELSKLHHRLRHVPYVPKIGITDTHLAFIEQAAAVIVVICEPADCDRKSLDLQQEFANEVSARREDDGEVPFVLVRFDSMGCDTDDEYSNVLLAPALSKQASIKAAQLLFKTET